MESEVPTADSDDRRTAYSPLVRRLAEEFDVDLDAIRGTGPGGRVTRADVQQAAFGPNLNHDQPMDTATLFGDDGDQEPSPGSTESVEETNEDQAEVDETAVGADHDDPAESTAEVDADQPAAEIEQDEPTAEAKADEQTAEVEADERPTSDDRGGGDVEAEAATDAGDEAAEVVSPPIAPAVYTLFADVEAEPVLRAQARLLADRDAETSLPALFVRLLAPAAELWTGVNGRPGDAAERDTVDVVMSVDGELVMVTDAGRRSLIELGAMVAPVDDDDEADADPVGASLAVELLIDTGVRAVAPMLWAGTKATIAIAGPRQELTLVDGRPRARSVLSLGVTCSGDVDRSDALGFLTAAASYLEDPVLVFAD